MSLRLCRTEIFLNRIAGIASGSLKGAGGQQVFNFAQRVGADPHSSDERVRHLPASVVEQPRVARKLRERRWLQVNGAKASALRLPRDSIVEPVHIPENPGYHIHSDEKQNQADFFHRASYLCKTTTKEFGDRQHSFGASRG